MEGVLSQLGLNPKEAQFYLFLLQEGNHTASEISKLLSESRTNTYMVLEKLEAEKLVVADDSVSVRRYAAVDPSQLRVRLNTELQSLKQRQSLLQNALPELSSLYNLGQRKPGVVHLEGINGFKILLEDMVKAKGVVDLLASDDGPATVEASELLQKGLAKRKAKGIRTRTIFHTGAKKWPGIAQFKARGLDVRFWGDAPRPGEMVIYDNKLAFTVYEPALITTVLTDEVLAQTFRITFDQLWQQAKR